MFETDIKNFVGLIMKNGTRKGYFVLDKPNKNCSAGSGDGSTGANFCIKSVSYTHLTLPTIYSV